MPPPPPPPICFPFTNKKPKQPKVRRRLSWSTGSDISRAMPQQHPDDKQHHSRRHEDYADDEEVMFPSDSEKYDAIPKDDFLPNSYKEVKLARGNTMTGTKKSMASWAGWGKKNKQNKEQVQVPLGQYPEEHYDEDEPIAPLPSGSRGVAGGGAAGGGHGGGGPSRSNTRSSQASRSTQRTMDSQRTMTSHRSHSSRSTVPKPRPPLMPQESTSTLVGSAFERKINDTETIREKPDTTDRLHELRRLMEKDNLDYYVIPSEDAHGSEYVAFSDKRREYISGFTGSAGQAIVTRNNAYLLTDSRYWGQAQQEIDHNWTLVPAGSANEPKDWIEWILSRVRSSRIGIDARMISHEKATLINSKISTLDSKLVYPPQNLVDLVWKDKPEKSKAAVYIQHIEYTGKDAGQKIAKIREWIKAQPATLLPYSKREPTAKDMQTGTLITALPQIAYLLNLRGADIPYNPLFHAYLYVGLDRVVLFLDAAKVVDEVASYLKNMNVERRDYTDLWQFLRRREYGEGRVLISPQTSYAISLMLTHTHYTVCPSKVEEMMSVKNEVEIDCMRRAYLRDGVSFVRFLAWLETKLGEGYDITEYEAASRLTEFRRKSKNFMGLAYENISASGPNAALPHYVARKSTARMIDRETPYLNDSGGQYLDGTCDTTRTVHFGRPSAEQIEAFTRVLQGHIAIDSAIFPEGTSGHQLDVLARKALWKDGLNYLHGTGHGFGSFLTVHEGPHSFSSNVPLVPGHVITNEPGFYLQNKWGVRIESSLLVKRVKTRGEFNGDIWLGFERLTCVPIQMKMVKESMLSKEEKAWLKDHNQRCYERLAPLLKDDKRALKWLKREADRDIGLAAAPVGMAIEWS
ncbi:aminopeptidase-P [Coprinopsis sp. MPI-PUGE-AT-0042]|nr:aminopeptidase-P [Coprinopsis sp. MPI-PUGE-AT-0042]